MPALVARIGWWLGAIGSWGPAEGVSYTPLARGKALERLCGLQRHMRELQLTAWWCQQHQGPQAVYKTNNIGVTAGGRSCCLLLGSAGNVSNSRQSTRQTVE